MSRTRTLTNLIADCRRLAKMENSTFCSDADITELLNQEIAELHWHLHPAGQPHLRSSSTVSVVAGTATYALPADFWQLQGVEATIDGVTATLEPFMPFERGPLSDSSNVAGGPVMYRIQGANIEFLPSTETFTATVFYTPGATRLVNGSDTLDGFNGYEVACIYGTVAQMLAMEESDPSFWEGRRARVYQQIDAMAAQRDASMPERVQDVMSTGGEWLI